VDPVGHQLSTRILATAVLFGAHAVVFATPKPRQRHKRRRGNLGLGGTARFHGKRAPQPVLYGIGCVHNLAPTRMFVGALFHLRTEMKVKTFLGTDAAEVDKLVNEWLAETKVAVRRTSTAFHRFRDRGKDAHANGCPPPRRHSHFCLVRRTPGRIAN
jgi:hypothetical protein